MRVVDGYIRVSRVAGREGESFISPAEQRRAIEGWADLHRRDLGEVFEDLDQSGKQRHRPGLDAAMERIRSGVSGGIVVAKLDRFGRSVPHLGELLAILDEHDAALFTVSEGLDTSGNTGRMIATILSAVAEFEVNRVSESWQVARRNAVERGVFVGGNVPIGYDKVDGRLVPNKDADAVREVFARRIDGHAWSDIASFLKAETGRRVPAETIRYLVRNRTYLGEIHAGQGVVNREGHEALVTEAVFVAANQLKASAPSPSGKGTGLLSGILRCASCRYALRYSMGKTRHGKPRADYRCKAGGRAASDCPDPVSVSASAIEPYVVDVFLRRVEPAVAREVANDTTELEARVVAAEMELDAILSADLRRAAGEDSDAFIRAVTDRREALEVARAELESAQVIGEMTDLSVIGLWPDLDLVEQRNLLASALDAVFIRPGGTVPDRVFICWPGEAPDLPIRGQRWTPEPFNFPAATRPGVEDAG